VCNSNEVEDELHFVTACNAFTSQCSFLYNEIKDRTYKKMSYRSNFIWKMSNEDEIIIKQFADFIITYYKLGNNSEKKMN
jgi:hypothetical protein